MRINGWKYYNHAAIPSTAPHEVPDLSPLTDGSIWNIEGRKPLLVRYTTDWDSKNHTNWWYVIKDSPFDISLLKTKRRYEITKAKRFFDVREIDPIEYVESLMKVHEKALMAYPAKYRPMFDKDLFKLDLMKWHEQVEKKTLKIYGAFFKETGKLCGYSCLILEKKYCDFAIQKTIPAFEKYNVNAALVNGILESFKDMFVGGYYICDGSRSIYHETHFQDYLEKYFGFRKAYCKLKIIYFPFLKKIVSFLYAFRSLIYKFGQYNGLFHQLSAILKMEEISRK